MTASASSTAICRRIRESTPVRAGVGICPALLILSTIDRRKSAHKFDGPKGEATSAATQTSRCYRQISSNGLNTGKLFLLSAIKVCISIASFHGQLPLTCDNTAGEGSPNRTKQTLKWENLKKPYSSLESSRRNQHLRCRGARFGSLKNSRKRNDVIG